MAKETKKKMIKLRSKQVLAIILAILMVGGAITSLILYFISL